MKSLFLTVCILTIVSRPDELKYVLDHVHELVIKPVDEAGGYGISIGNRLMKKEIEK